MNLEDACNRPRWVGLIAATQSKYLLDAKKCRRSICKDRKMLHTRSQDPTAAKLFYVS
jgi:hypothetical protein